MSVKTRSERETWEFRLVAQVKAPPSSPPPVHAVGKQGPLHTGSKLRQYYTINGRLYFVIGVHVADDTYVVENCETGFQMQVTGTYLKEVKWIARGRSS